MKIPFTKFHGAKNDFLLTRSEEVPAGVDLAKVAVEICSRYTGVGADGWLLVAETAGNPDQDARIRLFNSDGSEPELSGNGTRCVGAMLAIAHPSRPEFRIATPAGTKLLRLVSRKGNECLFEMNMGEVNVVELRARVQGRDAVLLDVGNPQCALPVEDFDFDWRAAGKAIEHDPRFPNRTNVSFVRTVDPHTIDVLFWERGAEETMSSGTGSTGAAVAAIARGFVQSPVTILTPAGALHLRTDGNEAWLTGPAELIAEGCFYTSSAVSAAVK